MTDGYIQRLVIRAKLFKLQRFVQTSEPGIHMEKNKTGLSNTFTSRTKAETQAVAHKLPYLI